jgi:hypothetical protein
MKIFKIRKYICHYKIYNTIKYLKKYTNKIIPMIDNQNNDYFMTFRPFSTVDDTGFVSISARMKFVGKYRRTMALLEIFRK